jgi:predicted DsbA family dithiol-disulfide isomerase
MSNVQVTVYTDPGCPFGFNAQRQDLQLQWHDGDAIDVNRRMIVLMEETMTYEERGLPIGVIADAMQRLLDDYEMPMLATPAPRMAATIDGCRAFIGAELNDPDRAVGLLRALRTQAFSHGNPLDEPQTIHNAAREVGIEPATIDAWLAADDVAALLAEDMAAARAPVPEALALGHRLSGPAGSRRYSTASAIYENDGRTVAAAGFQPFAVHEVAMANVAPDVERRPSPDTVDEILNWAPYPLATAEIAAIRDVPIDKAREELEQSGASFSPAASDGYWAAAH